MDRPWFIDQIVAADIETPSGDILTHSDYALIIIRYIRWLEEELAFASNNRPGLRPVPEVESWHCPVRIVAHGRRNFDVV